MACWKQGKGTAARRLPENGWKSMQRMGVSSSRITDRCRALATTDIHSHPWPRRGAGGGHVHAQAKNGNRAYLRTRLPPSLRGGVPKHARSVRGTSPGGKSTEPDGAVSRVVHACHGLDVAHASTSGRATSVQKARGRRAGRGGRRVDRRVFAASSDEGPSSGQPNGPVSPYGPPSFSSPPRGPSGGQAFPAGDGPEQHYVSGSVVEPKQNRSTRVPRGLSRTETRFTVQVPLETPIEATPAFPAGDDVGEGEQKGQQKSPLRFSAKMAKHRVAIAVFSSCGAVAIALSAVAYYLLNGEWGMRRIKEALSVGRPTAKAGVVVSRLQGKEPRTTKHPVAKVAGVDSSSPAEAAGLQAGDKVVRLGSVASPASQSDLERAVTSSETKTVDVVVLRNGSEVPLSLAPIVNANGEPTLGFHLTLIEGR